MATREQFELNVKARTAGKHFSRGSRMVREIPAVVYGPKTEPVNILLQQNDAIRFASSKLENAIINLKSENPKINGLKVLRKSYDLHPLSRLPIHMDFLAPDMTKAVRVPVELRFEGKAEGTKEGGLLSIVRREVEVECLPTEIPAFIAVDVSPLMLNSSMHVSDISVPEGVKLITSSKETICTCSVVEEEVIAAPTAAATPAEGAAAAPAAGGAPAAPGAAAPAAGAAAPAAGGEKKK